MKERAMICINGYPHSWSSWWARQDPMNPPEDGFYYARECQILGCNLRQHARELVPEGETLFVEVT